MDSDGAQKISGADLAEGSETTIEIKLKTLDSQTYTLRVDKQMPVPALKEQVASVTGVLSEQQRLICRGKVLKDDQLLSAYHVEDGHTLHLVVRQPAIASSDGLPNHSASDPASNASRGHVAPSVVIETFSMPDHGDNVPPEISRIVSAVLGSFGFSNFGSGSEGIDLLRERAQHRSTGAGGTPEVAQVQTEQAGSRVQSDGSQSAFGLPTAVSLGSLHPPVILDSLTTLSQYLNHMRREVIAIETGGENIIQGDAAQRTEQRDNSTSRSGTVQERLPTPASLAEVIMSSRQFMNEQFAECLQQLARQLENEVNVTDAATRLSTQSDAWRTGVQLHNLGAFLLELGRTTMTLRLGQAPSEAVVNAGPAVFINSSGPNPLMVQPLPFQSGTHFGAIPAGSVQTGSGMVNGIGTGFLPRRIDIQIRRGSSMASPNITRDERGDTQQPSGQRNPGTDSGGENLGNQTTSRATEISSLAGESGVRVVPIRTMVATMPGPFSRLPSDSSSNSIGLYYPVVGRFQHVASQVTGARGSQAPGEHNPAGVQTELQSTTEPAVQLSNAEQRTRDGSLPNSNLRQQGPSSTRNININIVAAGGTQNNPESERQNSILQLLRNLLPGGEINVEGAGLQGAAAGSSPGNTEAFTAPAESQSAPTDEGIFLSNLLREIMPVISQRGVAEARANSEHASDHQMVQDSSTQAEASNAGSTRRHSDTEPTSPNSKRQKRE
ncbi:ubiquitin-like domain-containing protein CIP73 [Mercurialis annua]|uniref:ubiquitin-like domain-containing protein CIP73 n=1 Tax=Mercurialis annua TaxID=3986 RepID=UPI00215FFADE|nr:ubiquitin-like domain-containing protein CIP73 [Mercurialis annua]